mgnify:FL=1
MTAGDGRQALASLFGYLSIISRPEEDLVAEVLRYTSPQVREEVMELEEMLAIKKREEGRTEGRAEGRAEGRVEGRAEGRADILLKLLRLKFGEPGPETVARVRAGSEQELDRWAERILTAGRLADVFA